MPAEDLVAQQSGQNTDQTALSQQKTINYKPKPENIRPREEELTNPARSPASPKKQTSPQQQSKLIDQNQKIKPTENIKIFPSNTKNMPPEPDALESRREIKTRE